MSSTDDRYIVTNWTTWLILIYKWCSVTEQYSIRWLSACHLSKWVDQVKDTTDTQKAASYMAFTLKSTMEED